MKKSYFLATALLAATPLLAQTNRVGIGTTTPRAGLDVQHDDGLVATGTGPVRNRYPPFELLPGLGRTDDLPAGDGTRLLWVPAKAAFRVGLAVNNRWDYANLGLCSMALGYATTASGDFSTALGIATLAGGYGSTALGNGTIASGNNSTALGEATQASGLNSTALGYGTAASGIKSTAIGYAATADGDYSTAMGMFVSTNGKTGSFVLGDFSSNFSVLNSSTVNEYSARFAGGYRLFTNAGMNVGVSLSASGNAWNVISDSTKKEGFRPANGTAFLQKIARMRLGSWHYKGQDARTMRHYGPMAQDFFAAFGHDGIGTVGCDTLINQADFDGVNLIAIKALIAEVESLRAENQRLQTQNAALGRETASLRTDIDTIKRLLVANTGK